MFLVRGRVDVSSQLDEFRFQLLAMTDQVFDGSQGLLAFLNIVPANRCERVMSVRASMPAHVSWSSTSALGRSPQVRSISRNPLAASVL